MRIELIIEYARELPWSPSRWGVDICGGLAERGHDVTVLCDGADDPEEFREVGASELVVRRPLRTVRGRDPRGFARWIEARPRTGLRLSLSRLVAGDVWLPIGPPARVDARKLVSRRNPASIAMDVLHEPWIPAAVLQERRAAAERESSITLEIGDARIGFASRLDGTASGEMRRRVRERLGIGPDQFVLVASAVHLEREGTRSMVEGLARRARAGDRLVALFAGRDAWSASRVGVETESADLVRPVGSTTQMGALFAACDAAVAPGDGEIGATGRFVADAVRMGRPVLCGSGAPGAALVTGARGIVVSEGTAEAWERAFEHARALGPVSDGADGVSMRGFVTRLEGVLADCGA